jgi:hypothetical protein
MYEDLSYVPNEVERLMLPMWKDVLRVHDECFKLENGFRSGEITGDVAIARIDQLQKEIKWGVKELPWKEYFDYSAECGFRDLMNAVHMGELLLTVGYFLNKQGIGELAKPGLDIVYGLKEESEIKEGDRFGFKYYPVVSTMELYIAVGGDRDRYFGFLDRVVASAVGYTKSAEKYDAMAVILETEGHWALEIAREGLASGIIMPEKYATVINDLRIWVTEDLIFSNWGMSINELRDLTGVKYAERASRTEMALAVSRYMRFLLKERRVDFRDMRVQKFMRKVEVLSLIGQTSFEDLRGYYYKNIFVSQAIDAEMDSCLFMLVRVGLIQLK